jgi:dihydrofolate synthase/folylpolyglutamate synthase
MIGRWMIISKNPWVITDAAHNQHGMKAMLPELARIKAARRHFVLGFVSDKDVGTVLALFPKRGIYYWCSPDIPRGKPAKETQTAGSYHGLTGDVYENVRQAFEAAIHAAGRSDLVFVGGSSYVVGDFLSGIRHQGK